MTTLSAIIAITGGVCFAAYLLLLFSLSLSIRKDWKKAQADYERAIPFTLLRGAYERRPEDWELLFYYAKYKGNPVGLPTYKEWSRYWTWKHEMSEEAERKRKEAEQAEKQRKSDELAAELFSVYAGDTPPTPPKSGVVELKLQINPRSTSDELKAAIEAVDREQKENLAALRKPERECRKCKYFDDSGGKFGLCIKNEEIVDGNEIMGCWTGKTTPVKAKARPKADERPAPLGTVTVGGKNK